MSVSSRPLHWRWIMGEPILQSLTQTFITRMEQDIQTGRRDPAHRADVANQSLLKSVEVHNCVRRVDRADCDEISTASVVWKAELYGVQAACDDLIPAVVQSTDDSAPVSDLILDELVAIF